MTKGLVRKNNLSDLPDSEQARENLGLRTSDYNRIRGLYTSAGVSNVHVQRIAGSAGNYQEQLNTISGAIGGIDASLYVNRAGDSIAGEWTNTGTMGAVNVLVSGLPIQPSSDALFTHEYQAGQFRLVATGLTFASGLSVERFVDRGNLTMISGATIDGRMPVAINGENYYVETIASPSLDLNFAGSKSLIDSVSGNNLITFARSTTGTSTNASGFVQVVASGEPRFDHAITSTVTNLLFRSEEFDNIYWTKTATSIVANAIASPTGSITAEALIEDSTNSQHFIGSQVIPWLGNTQYTFTLYVKAAGRDTFLLLLGTGTNWVNDRRGVIFNLTSGTIEFQDGLPVVGSIQNIGNGWFRCRVTSTTTASPSASAVFLRLYNQSILSGGTGSYQGDGTSGVYIWGAQLEQSSTVGEYVPTTSSTATKITTESLGLLVEEQRTNLLLRSEEFDNAPWGTQGTAPTITANAITAPNGTLTADRITFAAADSRRTQSNLPIVSGVSYTISVYALAVANTNNRFRFALFDQSTSFTSGDVTVSSTTWQRYSYTFTSTQTNNLGFLQIRNASDSAANDIYFWGAQLEAGAFPTSYIPTTTAAVTRAADVVSITGTNFSSWYRQDEGTFLVETIGAPIPSGGFPLILSVEGAANTDRIRVTRYSDGRGRFPILTGNVVQAAFDVLPAWSQGAVGRAAVAFRADDIAGCANGGTVVTDNSATLPQLTQLAIGSSVSSADYYNGCIRRLIFWPQRLLNSRLPILPS